MKGNLRLGDHCTKIGSGATPRGGKSSYLPHGPFALIRSQNVLNDRFNKDGLAFINEEQARKLDSVEVRKGDVLLNITGDSVARVCQVADDALPARVNQHVAIIRPNPATIDPRYLRYFMVSPTFQDFLMSMASSGATRNALTKGMIEDFEIPCRPVEEQREIGALLGALDDKIELNRRMSATLEEMARALYRSWFVDFDPVHARALGQSPAHMDATTAALFPDSFGPDGLPKGWKSIPLLDFMDLISGGTPKTSEASYWGGGIPWASAKDVSQCGQAFLTKTERSITRKGLDKSSTKIVPKFSTVLVARGATTGRACMFGDDIAMNQTCYALKSKTDEPFFTNCMFMHEVLGITLAAHGSVFDTITSKTLQAAQVTAPSAALSQAFEEKVSPMFAAILNRTAENETLSALRDSLLPRLMSGDLRIRETEERVEEVLA